VRPRFSSPDDKTDLSTLRPAARAVSHFGVFHFRRLFGSIRRHASDAFLVARGCPQRGRRESPMCCSKRRWFGAFDFTGRFGVFLASPRPCGEIDAAGHANVRIVRERAFDLITVSVASAVPLARTPRSRTTGPLAAVLFHRPPDWRRGPCSSPTAVPRFSHEFQTGESACSRERALPHPPEERKPTGTEPAGMLRIFRSHVDMGRSRRGHRGCITRVDRAPTGAFPSE